MAPRTKLQNEEIRLQRLAQIRKAAAVVFLDKGPLLEIRDVAAQAGLGYGTVYHYYSNKGDLLYDLLWDALERTEEWLASREASKDRNFSIAAVEDNGNTAAANFQSSSCETSAGAELGPAAAAGVRLLQLWAEDHALYLLHKLAGEGFASFPEARSTLLSEAFCRQVLEPLSALLETMHREDGAPAGANLTGPQDRQQRAEMLLGALVGCASLSLRRGKLHEESDDIVRFLKL